MSSKLTNLLRNQFRVILVGPPGCAKTARVLASASTLGWKFFYGIDGRTCDLMDRLDAAGAVVPDTAAGVARSLPLQALRDVLECREPAVWFLDEIGRAPIDVQGALCSVIDRLRRDGSPVVVVAATNRPQDKAGVASLSEQLRSRFDCAFAIATPDVQPKSDGPAYLGSWSDEVNGWCDYAADAEFDPVVVAWHRSTTGRTLYQWKPNADAALRLPDFRSWETVARLFAAGLRDLDSVSAAIGRPAAAEFLAFAALADQLPTPQQVFADPDAAPVPAEPAAQYLIASMLARAVTAKVAAQFVTYIDRLPRVAAGFAARDAFRRVGPKLTACAEWQTWFLNNQALFR